MCCKASPRRTHHCTGPSSLSFCSRAGPLSFPWVQEQIKSLIVDLMLSAPQRVRSQLSEALSIISSHDFPAKWHTLLPLLIDKLRTDDMQLVNGVLSTADSIYQRYR